MSLHTVTTSPQVRVRHRSRRCRYKHKSTRQRWARRQEATVKYRVQTAKETQPPQLPRFDFEVYITQRGAPGCHSPLASPQSAFERSLFFDLSYLPEPTLLSQQANPQPQETSRLFESKTATLHLQAEHPQRASVNAGSEPSAANLWNILTVTTYNKFSPLLHRKSSDLTQSDEEGGVKLPVEASGMQVESNGATTIEEPHVHTGHLFRHDNDIGFDVMIKEPTLEKQYDASYSAQEERTPTYELAATPCPLPPSGSTAFAATIGDSGSPSTSDADHGAVFPTPRFENRVSSLSQFDGERQLFDQDKLVPNDILSNDDKADARRTNDHARNCRCRDCRHKPVFLHSKADESLGECDGWMMWADVEDDATHYSDLEWDDWSDE